MNWLEKAWSRLFDNTYQNLENEEQVKAEKYLDDKYNRITLVYKKRFADIQDKVLLPMLVNDFLKPMNTLKDDMTLSNIWRQNITYISDNYQVNGVLDYWQLPVETLTLKGGDCEDSSHFRVTKAKSNGLGSNLFVALGLYKGGGHAFPIMIKNDKIYLLEATSNEYNPIDYDSQTNYKIYYISNERFSWTIDGSIVFGKKVRKELGVDVQNGFTKKNRGKKKIHKKSAIKPKGKTHYA
jgi:hypothetical protein